MSDEQKRKLPHERLFGLLQRKFGMDWQKDVKLTIRADRLYWLVYLADYGLEAKRQEFKQDRGKSMTGLSSIEKVCNLSDWSINLDLLVSQVEELCK